MKVLMISTDKKIFDDNSSVRARMIEYGSLVGELHIIIFSLNIYGEDYAEEKISNNIYIYPTISRSKWFYVSDGIKIGKKIIKKFGPKINDILVSSQDPFEAGLVAFFISRKTKIKLQLQIHTDFLSAYFSLGNFLNKIRFIIAMFIIPKADYIRVVSERIKNSLINKFGTDSLKITILPIFVDLGKFKKNNTKIDLHKKYPQFKKIILMVSRLEKEKNIPLVISAFVHILKKYPDSGMIIVGDGRERNKLQNWAKAYNIEKKVIFLGWQKDISDYYHSADLFVSASNYEGYGLSILEAYASNIPILTTDVGLVGEVVKKEDVHLCPVGDIECFINKMTTALSGRTDIPERAQLPLKVTITKKEYLNNYKKHWEKCLIHKG